MPIVEDGIDAKKRVQSNVKDEKKEKEKMVIRDVSARPLMQPSDMEITTYRTEPPSQRTT